MKVWIEVLTLLVAFSAVAEKREERLTWRGDVSGGLSVESQSDVGVSLLYLGPTAGAEFYFRPLIDDSAVPLGLLRFVQHPGGVSVSGTVIDLLVSRASRPTPQSSGIYEGGLALDVYPWRDTGLFAAANLQQRSIDDIAQIFGDLGVDHYFSRDVHASLAYVFDRAEQNVFASQGLVFYQRPLNWSSDGAGLGATFLLANERLELVPKIDLGWVHSTYAGASSYGHPATAVVFGAFYDASLAATWYFQRSLSVSLTPGVNGQALVATATSWPPWIPSGISYVAVRGDASCLWFATESVFLNLHYRLTAKATVGAGTVLDHLASLSIGSRL